jgi:hypothetical protein
MDILYSVFLTKKVKNDCVSSADVGQRRHLMEKVSGADASPKIM